jgi:beta-1,4-mannosyl-glycoprotein beta-1,4-N-acetylglucosaminyltransferase
MIVDTFTFFNEFDILDIRLHELNDLVDYFVLVEAAFTQSLKPKPFFFGDNKKRFEKFLPKIIHVQVQEIPKIDSLWTFEIYQRNCISIGLQQLKLKQEDTVLISDVDEIPRREVLQQTLPELKDVLVYAFGYHVYYLNLKVIDNPWKGTVAVTGTTATNNPPHSLIKVRDIIDVARVRYDAGWHLGYQGGKEIIYGKYFSCVEPMNKAAIPTKEVFDTVFKECARDGGNFIFCDDLSKKHLKLQECPIEVLPQFVQYNKERFDPMLWKRE